MRRSDEVGHDPSQESPVRVERDGPVTTVVIARPGVRNAVDNRTADALADAFRDFDRDPDASVAVLWGEGGTFCAGADLKSVASGERTARYRSARDGDGPMGPSRLELSKPVIAAVSGYAVAGGLELALWCDLRVVERDATFGVFCRRWGVPLIDGGTVRLPRLIGLSRALDMILTGRPVGAEEAERFGLANRVVETGRAREEAEKLAHEIARFPQLCLRADRQSAHDGLGTSLAEALVREFERGQPIIQAEAVAGAKRFVDGAGRGGRFDDRD